MTVANGKMIAQKDTRFYFRLFIYVLYMCVYVCMYIYIYIYIYIYMSKFSEFIGPDRFSEIDARYLVQIR